MPTFHFYREGLKVGEVVGADKGKLEALIVQHGTVEEVSLQKLLATGQDLSDILTKSIRKIYEVNSPPVAQAALGNSLNLPTQPFTRNPSPLTLWFSG